MNVSSAFERFQTIVNADAKDVTEARRRRDLFKGAFADEPDVALVKPSGSLARGTQKDPIHDVDVLIVFEPSSHPGWGTDGATVNEALDHTRAKVHELLGSEGTYRAGEVRLARWRNHAVKCFLDDPEDPGAFTVDATPAIKLGERYLIPEANSDRWIQTHPQYLLDAVAARHAEWNKYAGTVRMLKWWASDQAVEIKSLVMEVLALDYLPTGHTRWVALREFFTRAALHVESGLPIEDPAGVCGAIQADLDYAALGTALRAARDNAAAACAAQAQNDDAGAIRSWGLVFGDRFPKPPAGVTPLVAPAPRPVKDTPQG